MRLRSAVIAAVVLAPVLVAAAGTERPAEGAENGLAVYVYTRSTSTERLSVSEGRADDCDSGGNEPLFDGEIQPKQMLRIPIHGYCVCLSHTTESGWTPSQLYCGTVPTPSGSGRGRRSKVPVGPTSFTIGLDG